MRNIENETTVKLLKVKSFSENERRNQLVQFRQKRIRLTYFYIFLRSFEKPKTELFKRSEVFHIRRMEYKSTHYLFQKKKERDGRMHLPTILILKRYDTNFSNKQK